MEGYDAISLGVYKERGLPDERGEKKSRKEEIRTRTVIEKKRENSVSPHVRTSSSCELVKNLLNT